MTELAVYSPQSPSISRTSHTQAVPHDALVSHPTAARTVIKLGPETSHASPSWSIIWRTSGMTSVP
jgi:hypothetical protein